MTAPASTSEDSDTRPLLAGVMGWPITHSKSPLIFAHWFAENGIAAFGGRRNHSAYEICLAPNIDLLKKF